MARNLRRAATVGGTALLSLALLASSVAARAPVAVRAGPALLAGVNIPGPGGANGQSQADREIALAQQLHAKVVRVEMPWDVLEPARPNRLAPRPLAFTDRLVADASADGIKVIMTADATPCWASSAPRALVAACRASDPGLAEAWPPTKPAAYAAYVAFLAGRYGPDLAAIEIWNEPDEANQLYFAGPDKARRYASILRSAYPAIKLADPAVTVLAGSLVGSNGAFLRALYEAGIKGYYDGLAVHFYSLTLASLRSIRTAQLAAGDTKPLWLDEFGWGTCLPRRTQQGLPCVTQQVQAANVTNTFRSLAHTSYVAAATIFKLQDGAGIEFGLLTAEGKPKLAFGALAGVLASPFGPVTRTTVSLRRSGNQIVVSGSAPVGDFMELEAFQGVTLRYRAVFTLDRFNRYSLVLPVVLGTSGLRVDVYRYGSGPASATDSSI